MEVQTVLALIGATAVLVAIPGPNVALIIANTLARGLGIGALTVLGTTAGVGVQLAVVVSGLAALIAFAATALVWLKWAGVCYLIWLGVMAWRAGSQPLAATASRKTAVALFWQGFAIALINPKTLFFNAAFLSQFINTESDAMAVWGLAAVFLSVVFVGDLIWAVCARSARDILARHGALRHRVTGVLLVGAGLGLALARAER